MFTAFRDFFTAAPLGSNQWRRPKWKAIAGTAGVVAISGAVIYGAYKFRQAARQAELVNIELIERKSHSLERLIEKASNISAQCFDSMIQPLRTSACSAFDYEKVLKEVKEGLENKTMDSLTKKEKWIQIQHLVFARVLGSLVSFVCTDLVIRLQVALLAKYKASQSVSNPSTQGRDISTLLRLLMNGDAGAASSAWMDEEHGQGLSQPISEQNQEQFLKLCGQRVFWNPTLQQVVIRVVQASSAGVNLQDSVDDAWVERVVRKMIEQCFNSRTRNSEEPDDGGEDEMEPSFIEAFRKCVLDTVADKPIVPSDIAGEFCDFLELDDFQRVVRDCLVLSCEHMFANLRRSDGGILPGATSLPLAKALVHIDKACLGAIFKTENGVFSNTIFQKLQDIPLRSQYMTLVFLSSESAVHQSVVEPEPSASSFNLADQLRSSSNSAAVQQLISFFQEGAQTLEQEV